MKCIEEKATVEKLLQHLDSIQGESNVEYDTCLCQISNLVSQDDIYRSYNVLLADLCAVEKNFLPLLLKTCSDKKSKFTIKLLINLLSHMTVPVECPEHYSPVICLHDEEKLAKAQDALLKHKKAFLSYHQSTDTLVQLIRAYATNYDELMTHEERETDIDTFIAINVLYLLRNLLHTSDEMSQCYLFQDIDTSIHDETIDNEKQNVYRILVWNLLSQGIDDAILSIVNLQDHQALNCGLSQLIILLFKDQPVSKLQQIICAGHLLQDSSDDEIETESSSSLQLSSSSLFSSDDLSLTSSSKSSRNQGAQLKGEGDKKNACSSDSGISSEQRTSSDDSSQNNDNDTRNGCHTMTETNQLISGIDSMVVSDKSVNNSTSTRDKLDDGASKTEESKLMKRSSKTSRGDNDDGIKEETSEVRSQSHRSSREEQTSGISNGSSEEETRITRKVIKAHHRSALQPSESDSSDEYNTKPECVPEATGRKGKQNVKSSRVHSTIIQSKCSPSFCMEAAIETTNNNNNNNSNSNSSNKSHTSLSLSLIAPWDKKKLHRSYPLDLTSYIPRNEDIGKLLEDFVYKFLHNSFARITLNLTDQLIDQTIDLDEAHFAWLLSYFMNFAVAIDLDYHHISSLLSPSIFSFLVYRGNIMNEELKSLTDTLSKQDEVDESRYDENVEKRKILLRKMHLTVSALKELFNAIISYSDKCLTYEQSLGLQNVRYTLAEMADLHQLLFLYIRNYDPNVYSKQFLVDAITTHHVDMIILEPAYLEGRFDLLYHLRQFATTQIMHLYGKVLQDYETNGEFVNDCILTLMHHVAGDLMAPEVLFQPIILKTFSLIMDSQTQVKNCWEQLIDYTLIKFVRAADKLYFS